jgi:WD40 repeat protein
VGYARAAALGEGGGPSHGSGAGSASASSSAHARLPPRLTVLGRHAGPVLDVAVDPTGGRHALAGDTRGGLVLYDTAALGGSGGGPAAVAADEDEYDGGGAGGSSSAAPAAAPSRPAVVARYPAGAGGGGGGRAPAGPSDAADAGVSSGGGGGRPFLRPSLPGHAGAVTALAWYPHDAGMFVSGGTDSRLVFWDTGAFVPAFALGGLEGPVYDAAMSPAGAGHTLVAAGCGDARLRLGDARSLGWAATLTGHTDAVVTVGWHPSCEWVLASGSRDGSVRLWDARRAGHGTGAQLAAADASTGALAVAAGRAPSSSSSAAAGAHRPVAHAGGGGVAALAWLPALPPAGGHCPGLPPGWPPGSGVAPSPHVLTPAEALGRGWGLVTAGGSDGALRRWHVQDGTGGDDGDGSSGGSWRVSLAPVPLPGARLHGRRRSRLAEAPVDGAGGCVLFAPAGAGGAAVAVIDGGAGGSPLATLTGHHAPVAALAWAPATGVLVSAGEDGLVLAWSGRLLDGGGGGGSAGGGSGGSG